MKLSACNIFLIRFSSRNFENLQEMGQKAKLKWLTKIEILLIGVPQAKMQNSHFQKNVNKKRTAPPQVF